MNNVAHNAQLNHNSLVVNDAATLATRLASPQVGDQHVNKQTGALLVYYGTALGWCPPWNMPWGIQAFSEINLSSAILSTYGATQDSAPIAGLSLSFKPLVGRQYVCVFDGLVNSTVNNDQIWVVANTDTGGLTTATKTYPPPGGSFGAQVFQVIMSGIAGTPARALWRFTHSGNPYTGQVAFWCSATRLNGTGDCVIAADTEGTSRFYIEDLGPSANPIYN